MLIGKRLLGFECLKLQLHKATVTERPDYKGPVQVCRHDSLLISHLSRGFLIMLKLLKTNCTHVTRVLFAVCNSRQEGILSGNWIFYRIWNSKTGRSSSRIQQKMSRISRTWNKAENGLLSEYAVLPDHIQQQGFGGNDDMHHSRMKLVNAESLWY